MIFRFSVAILLCTLISCASVEVPVAIPRFPRKHGHQLRKTLEGHRNLAVVTVKPDRKAIKKLGQAAGNWDNTIEAAVSKSIAKLDYYNVINIESRKKRLQELAYSQSGLTKESLEIGRELQVQAFLIVRMTNPPRIECKIEEVEDYVATTAAIAVRAIVNPDNAGKINTGRRTGVRYVTIFVEGKITNIETGRSVSHLYTGTKRIASKPGNRVCTSPYKALGELFIATGQELAKNLSPRLNRLNVSLMTTSKDVQGEKKAEVDARIQSGIEWAKNGDMDEAKIEWEAALERSGQRSGAAIWNLAVYYWHIGDFDQAHEYFEKIKRTKSYLLDNKKRRIIAIFNHERKNVE